MLILLASIAVLLCLSALFSGAEAAFFSLPGWQVEELPRLKTLLSRPRRLLGTLLLGNLIVNTTATALWTLLLLKLIRQTGIAPAGILGAGGLVMTALLLLVGEISPKVIANRHALGFARHSAPLLHLIYRSLAPLTVLLEKMDAPLALIHQEPAELTDEESHTLIEIAQKRGVLLPGEEEILRNIVDLDRRTVSEVMTPRSDIVAIPENTPLHQAREVFARTGFSRLPVYHDTIDRITGILYAKELLIADDDTQPALTIARKPYFVPEVKRLPALLDELRRKNSHIAIVVDEFGQTAGLVTLEDILEAVFGEITDEFDRAEELPYKKVAGGGYLVDGEIDLSTLNRLFSNAFQNLPHERLAGFIHDRLGRLPVPGDEIEFAGLKIVVQETSALKLEKVLIQPRKG